MWPNSKDNFHAQYSFLHWYKFIFLKETGFAVITDNVTLIKIEDQIEKQKLISPL